MTDWRKDAACARPGIARELRSAMTTDAPPLAAQLLCQGCPVAQQCLKWAYSEPDFEGLAGGVVFAEEAAEDTAWTPAEASRLWEQQIEEVEWLTAQGCTPGEVAMRLRMKVESVSRMLYRHGRRDLAVLMDKGAA